MKRILTSFVLLILSSLLLTLSAQNHLIDSLNAVLKTEQEDTNKVNTLNALSFKIEHIGSYTSADSIAQIGLHLAEKLNFTRGIGNSYKNIGNTFTAQGDYIEALKNYSLSLQQYEKISDKNGLTAVYGNIGAVYTEQGNYPEALKYQYLSLKIKEELGDKRGEGIVYGNIGVICSDEGNYSEALKNHFQGLKIDLEIGNKPGISTAYGNIGSIYASLENYEEALKYENLSLILDKEDGDKQGMAAAYENIGASYSGLKKDSLALDNLRLSLKLYTEIGDKAGMADSYRNIGSIYTDAKNYDEALKNSFKALQINEEIGNPEGLSNCYISVGDGYLRQKKYADSKIYLDSALTLSKKIGAKLAILTTYSLMIQLYSTINDCKAAYEASQNYIAYSDSVKNETGAKALAREEMQFKFDQVQEHEKAEQDKKDVLAAAEKKREMIIILAVSAGLLIVLIFSILLYSRYKVTQQQKKIIEDQKLEVEKQKTLVEEKNKDILDSITYAKRLQDAILPPISAIKNCLPESFVLYKPKDIVAGDFYWMWSEATSRQSSSGEGQNEIILIAAADCTGHGVPGAMVSVVCSNALNRTVKEFKITEPGKILDKVRELVLETFEKSEDNVQDGMDISLAAISYQPLAISWSGAYNSLWFIQNGEMKEVPADKQPIGKTDKPLPFNTHSLNLQKGDTLYLFTDGYADQFGGPKGKKFKYKQLQGLLLANATKPMEEQKSIFETALHEWKGNLEQVDDILIIGIKV